MGQSGPPLLIVCALRFERFALRAGRRRMDAAAGPVHVIRTGMGAQAAERAVTDALSTPEMKNAAVLTTGLCAGLAPGMRPGDVVVADEARDSDTLAAALKAAGHTVHIGRLAQSDHVVRGAEQGARPVAAARVVVDTPEYELVRVGTLRTGITAFRVLRDLLPAFLNWHRSTALPWR
jgi:nucleoside phosphorylase